jgi:hypothetical protein
MEKCYRFLVLARAVAFGFALVAARGGGESSPSLLSSLSSSSLAASESSDGVSSSSSFFVVDRFFGAALPLPFALLFAVARPTHQKYHHDDSIW